jgi:TonB family protein
MLFLLLMAQAAYYGDGTLPPAPPPGKKIGLFDSAAYPPEALRNHWQGDVRAELTISENGAVVACRIVQSSGHEVLDAATCNLIIKRARFVPAKDDSGKPIKDTVMTPTISWRLP